LNFRIALPALLAVSLLAAQTASANNNQIQENKNYAFDDTQWSEQDFTIPPYPAKPNWQEYFLSARRSNRLFIDLGSYSVGKDGVARYILRVQSPSGAENVSFEGIRCQGHQLRKYAFGDTVNHRWIESLKSTWRTIDYDDREHRELHDALCQDGAPAQTSEEAAKRLSATR
jgi:hypothetical protein